MRKIMNWYRRAEKTKNKSLIINRGPSGSGKSFLAREITKNGGYVFSTDDFLIENGEYIFDRNKLGKAHEMNKQRTEKAMKEGLSPIVVDNTNSTAWEFLPYIKMAKEYGYEIEYSEPNWGSIKNPDGTWNLDALIKNQQNKDRDKGKVVPMETIKRMVDRYEYKKPGETDQEFTNRILGQLK